MKKQEDAVSPVVGVMLMLVVTIIIAAVVAAFAGGVMTSQEPAPSAIVKPDDYNFVSYVSSGYPMYDLTNVTFKHMSGNPLDLSKVNASQVGTYQYTITYNGKVYTSTIKVYVQNVITPNTPEVSEKEEVVPPEDQPVTPTE